ncbi:MAG: hypothetical protein MHM6MM_005739, partial [Cercozoa sp. M6MM]
MLRRQLLESRQLCEGFAGLLCQCQEHLRRVNGGERSVVSLRDVSRALQVYRWATDEFIPQNVVIKNDRIRLAVILSIHFCYASRLSRDERSELIQKLDTKRLHFSLQPYDASVRELQLSLVQHMTLPRGVALNEALLENIFCCVVAILNRMPVFVVGKPGSSKSLALSLIQNSFNGVTSDNEFFRAFPNIEVFSYQCSPLSTSAGIEQVFAAALRYQEKAGTDSVATVLLDEIGLAEQSPHLPLKVLHKLFDENSGKLAVVGISNWKLDSSKMNRAIHLSRPPPTVSDLILTAKGIVGCGQLDRHMDGLARAYDEVYNKQQRADFFGLRDFYGLIRHLYTVKQELTPSLVSEARNFGGRSLDETMQILSIFFRHLSFPVSPSHIASDASVLGRVRKNLCCDQSRHLMLLTRNDAALSLLQDEFELTGADFFHGGDFSSNKSPAHVSRQLHRLKLAMADDRGRTVVLVHCEPLFESLYDVFNQHYTQCGAQSFVRVAFGHSSHLCPISKGFRVIVVVERTDAYTRLAPPLLNRFEKQLLDRRAMLHCFPSQRRRTKRLVAFSKNLARLALQRDKDHQLSASDMSSVFPGFHSDMCASLIQSDCRLSSDRHFLHSAQRLVRALSVKAMCALVLDSNYERAQEQVLSVLPNVELRDFFFGTSMHTSLTGLLASPTQHRHLLVLTYAPCHINLSAVVPGATSCVIALHELHSQRDFEDAVTSAADSSRENLVVEADLARCSARRVRYAQRLLSDTETASRIVLLVHLSREQPFALDFDRHWSRVCVDAIDSLSHILPPLESFLSKRDWCESVLHEVDFDVFVRQSFRRALSLVYRGGRKSLDSLRERIELLQRCLSADNGKKKENEADFLVQGIRRELLCVFQKNPTLRLHAFNVSVGSRSTTIQHA